MIEKNNHIFTNLHIVFGLKNTFVFLVSIVINGYLFGVNTGLLGALISLLYFIIPDVNININKGSKFVLLYIYIIISIILGVFAQVNMILGIAINLFMPLFLVLAFSCKENLKGYLFYYSLFIFAQITSYTKIDYKGDILTILVGLLIGFIFHEIIWKDVKVNEERISIWVHFKNIIEKKSITFSYKNNQKMFLFGIILSIVTCFSMIFWQVLKLDNWYWISVVTCFSISPVRAETARKIFIRIYATLLGIIIFLAFASFIDNKVFVLVSAIISIFLLIAYMPTGRNTEAYVFGTYIALLFASYKFSLETTISYRFLYTLIGGSIAFLILILCRIISNKVFKLE